MAPPQQPARSVTMPISLSRVLMFVACVLFVIAALFAGGVLTGRYLPWVLGGFAAVALSWAVT